MTETFKFSASLQTEGTINQKVQTSDFGDGYSQSTSIGINNQYEEWNVNFKGKASYINQIRDFLDRHEGNKSFYWTPPDGKQGRYRSTNYKINPLGGNAYELTSTFTQTFEPASVSASEYVRYINAIAPDKDGNVTLTALDVNAEDRGAAIEALTNLKAEKNPLPQYALKGDVPDITEIKNRLDTSESNITAAQSNISGLERGLNTTSENLSILQTQVGDEVISIKSDLSNQSSQIGILQTSVSTNTTDIAELKNGRVKTVNGVAADKTGNIQLEIDAGSEINDSVTAINSTWSSQNINNVLTDKTNINNGSGRVSYNPDLDYPEGTSGYAIKNSLADTAQLATNYADIASRLSILEGNLSNKNFTIIYPNGGTEASPANVDTNKRYELANPFPGYHVICIAELLIGGIWGETGWIYANNANYGVKASMLNLDKIVIVTGNGRIIAGAPDAGQTFPKGTAAPTSAPCRVKVWRQL